MTTLAELRAKHQKLIDEQNNKRTSDEKFTEYAKFEEGGKSNLIRILPGKENPLDFFVEVQNHYVATPDGKKVHYQCRKPHGEECPICELYFSLWKRHKELNLPKGTKSKFGDLATGLKPKSRFYMRAVIRALQATEESPVKYVVASPELFDIIMSAVTNPEYQDDNDPENTTIVSLDRGNDFDVVITKKDKYNSFVKSTSKIKKTKAGTPKEMQEWMDSPLDISTLVKISDYEEGKKLAQVVESTLNIVKTESTSTEEPPFDTDDSDEKFKQEMRV